MTEYKYECGDMAKDYFTHYFNEFCIRGDEVYWYDGFFVAFLLLEISLIAILYKKSRDKIKTMVKIPE